MLEPARSQPAFASSAATTAPPQRRLSLLDSTCIIVGIIIGASIYEKSPLVAEQASSAILGQVQKWAAAAGAAPFSTQTEDHVRLLAIAGIWILGGCFALVGALCYAELGTAYPQHGGNYLFLARAFGKTVGLAFAWVEFWIIRPGNTGAIAYVFAHYAGKLVGVSDENHLAQMGLAAGAITALSLANWLGLSAGKWTQNLLTGAKLLGLAVIVFTAFSLPSGETESTAPGYQLAPGSGSLGLALIFVMFAYGGWSDMSYVAAEVRDPARNIFRALLLGTLAVTGIYVTLNIAFALGLGLPRFLASSAIAADVLSLRFGPGGAGAISLLICISCLGAINGMIFTGSRLSYSLGKEDPLFAWLGRWNEARGVPTRSLVVQALVTLGLVIGFGLRPQGFDRLVIFTAPFFWGAFVLIGIAVVTLRDHDHEYPRVYRVPLYPLPPLIFSLSSLYMVYASLDWAIKNLSWEASWAALVLLAGTILIHFRNRAR